DLGTVPPEVPDAMARHNIHRLHVVQYELKPGSGEALPDAPAASVASINTHDMPPFAAYWDGQDIRQRLDLNLVTQGQGLQEQDTRRMTRENLVQFLREEGLVAEGV